MNEISDIDHEGTREIVCPHCGHEHRDSWETGDYGRVEDYDYTCHECEEDFRVTRHVSVTYSTHVLVGAA